MSANKMIIIANFKHIAKNKEEFFKLDGYKEYVSKKEKYQKILDTTLVHDEFDKYTKLLEDLQDPTEVYNIKYIALATKFDSYAEAIRQCEKKLDECIKASKEDFKLIMKHIDISLQILKKENIFKSVINKVINKLFRGSKFLETLLEFGSNRLKIAITKQDENGNKKIEFEDDSLKKYFEECKRVIELKYGEINIDYKEFDFIDLPINKLGEKVSKEEKLEIEQMAMRFEVLFRKRLKHKNKGKIGLFLERIFGVEVEEYKLMPPKIDFEKNLQLNKKEKSIIF